MSPIQRHTQFSSKRFSITMGGLQLRNSINSESEPHPREIMEKLKKLYAVSITHFLGHVTENTGRGSSNQYMHVGRTPEVLKTVNFHLAEDM